MAHTVKSLAVKVAKLEQQCGWLKNDVQFAWETLADLTQRQDAITAEARRAALDRSFVARLRWLLTGRP